jgi:putative acetyltransferase
MQGLRRTVVTPELPVIIREEAPADRPEVDVLLRDAFGGDDEAKLVSRLREDGAIGAALVAEADGHVVGHLVLSWLPAQMDGRPVRAVALAPMAVRPGHQRRGVGSRLVGAAIAQARQIGARAIVVLGHPAYYPRFGFSADLAAKLAAPFSGPAFMALELVPGALTGASGSVVYPPAFHV